MAYVSKRQKIVLDKITNFISENNYPPSVRELSGILSKMPSTIHAQLAALKAKGYIEWEHNRPRTLRIIGIPIEDCTGQIIDIIRGDKRQRYCVYGIHNGKVRGFDAGSCRGSTA